MKLKSLKILMLMVLAGVSAAALAAGLLTRVNYLLSPVGARRR